MCSSDLKVSCTRYVYRPRWKRPLIAQKVSDVKIVLAVDPDSSTSEGLDLPEGCRIVKLANNVTYDRSIHPVSACKVG